VIASAQTGIHPNGRRTFGHSQIIDPWGEVLACKEEGVGIATAQLDPKKIELVRKNLPALQHRYFINPITACGEGYG
jgi:deaminated glutathione amidase